METTTKIDVKAMKADIKKMVEEQKFYRNQRKTVNLVGERVISPSEATWKHRSNRDMLRLMYAAYGIARDKTFNQIENTHTEEPHPLEQYRDIINDRIEKYKIEVPVETVE